MQLAHFVHFGGDHYRKVLFEKISYLYFIVIREIQFFLYSIFYIALIAIMLFIYYFITVYKLKFLI